MLSLVLAESALEIVPEQLRRHPAVASSARRLGRSPDSTLLDVSWHHAAMSRLGGAHRRGRPDIAHFALLAATGTPLYAAGMLDVYVHTVSDIVVRLGPGTRLPKSYHRFAGLLGDVLAGAEGAGGKKAARADGSDGRPLLEARPEGLEQLLGAMRPSDVVGLSRSGAACTFKSVAADLAKAAPAAEGCRAGPCVVVGGFQRGGFSKNTARLLGRTASVGSMRLEAHVVISRMLYEFEEASGGSRA